MAGLFLTALLALSTLPVTSVTGQAPAMDEAIRQRFAEAAVEAAPRAPMAQAALPPCPTDLPTPRPGALRIMPLGDSITEGGPFNVSVRPGVVPHQGYRWPLYQRLINAGRNVEIVGTRWQPTWPDLAWTVPWHNGRSGAVIGPDSTYWNNLSGGWEGGWGFDDLGQPKYFPPEEPYDRIDRDIICTKPDVVLLMIGTNDLLRDLTIPGYSRSAPARLEALVRRIQTIGATAGKPNIKIIIGAVTPRLVPGPNPFVGGPDEQIELNMRAETLGNINPNDNIYFADMFNQGGFTPSDYYDDNTYVHFNASGADKMAAVWEKALSDAVFAPTPPCSGNNLLVNGNFDSSLDGWTNYTAFQSDFEPVQGVAHMREHGWLDQVINTVPGTRYFFSAWVRINREIKAPSQYGLWFGATDESVSQTYAQTPFLRASNTPPGTWRRVTFSFVANTARTRISFRNFAAQVDQIDGRFNADIDQVYVGTCSSNLMTPSLGSAAVCAVPNLIRNPGFDTNTLANWTVSGDLETIQNVMHMRESGFMEQTLNTTPGTTYYFSAWLRINREIQKPTNGNGLLFGIFSDTGVAYIGSPNYTSDNLTIGQWERVTLRFVAQTPRTRIVFGNYSNGTYDADIDQFYLGTCSNNFGTPVLDVPATCSVPNQIVNPNFADSLDGWTNYAFYKSDMQPLDGVAHMTRNGWMDQVVPTTPGTLYKFSAWVRINRELRTPKTYGLWLGVGADDFSATYVATEFMNAGNTPPGQWRRIEMSFTPTTNRTRITFRNFSADPFEPDGLFDADLDNVLLTTCTSNFAAPRLQTAAVCTAPNLARNGEFGSGLDQWTELLDAASPAGRLRGLFGITQMENAGWMFQTIRTAPNQPHYLSAWVRLNREIRTPSEGGLLLATHNLDYSNSFGSTGFMTRTALTVGQWQRVGFSFVPTGTQTNLTWRSFGDGLYDVDLDDLRVGTCDVEASYDPPRLGAINRVHVPLVARARICTTPNLVQNPNFNVGTGGLAGWGQVIPGGFTASNGRATMNGSGWLSQTVQTAPGQRYTASAWVRLRDTPVAPTDGLGLNFVAHDPPVRKIYGGTGVIDLSSRRDGRWFRVSFTFDATAAQTVLSFNNISRDGRFVVDLTQVSISLCDDANATSPAN
jgi:lysophospholipase L1-like esterase